MAQQLHSSESRAHYRTILAAVVLVDDVLATVSDGHQRLQPGAGPTSWPSSVREIFKTTSSFNGLERVKFRSVQYNGGSVGSGFQTAAARELAWSSGYSSDPGHTIGILEILSVRKYSTSVPNSIYKWTPESMAIAKYPLKPELLSIIRRLVWELSPHEFPERDKVRISEEFGLILNEAFCDMAEDKRRIALAQGALLPAGPGSPGVGTVWSDQAVMDKAVADNERDYQAFCAKRASMTEQDYERWNKMMKDASEVWALDDAVRTSSEATKLHVKSVKSITDTMAIQELLTKVHIEDRDLVLKDMEITRELTAARKASQNRHVTITASIRHNLRILDSAVPHAHAANLPATVPFMPVQAQAHFGFGFAVGGGGGGSSRIPAFGQTRPPLTPIAPGMGSQATSGVVAAAMGRAGTSQAMQSNQQNSRMSGSSIGSPMDFSPNPVAAAALPQQAPGAPLRPARSHIPHSPPTAAAAAAGTAQIPGV